MKTEKKVNGKRIYLKLLKPSDVTESYVAWMNDPQVTMFLESRWNRYHIKSIKKYVKDVNSDRSSLLFGVFLKKTGMHIGNIKIGNIDTIHRFADVGLIIGEKSMWGNGYGTEAIALVTNHAFKKLKLNKLIAGIYANNHGSFKAFIKAGYQKAGILKKHRISEGGYVDEVLVEKGRS